MAVTALPPQKSMLGSGESVMTDDAGREMELTTLLHRLVGVFGEHQERSWSGCLGAGEWHVGLRSRSDRDPPINPLSCHSSNAIANI